MKGELSGQVNGHLLPLKHAAVVRQTESYIHVQFPRVDTASNTTIEFRAVGIYIQEFRGDDRIRIPFIFTRNIQQEYSRCSQGSLDQPPK